MVSAWSFGTALRDRAQMNGTPGPGSYQPIKNQKVIPPQWKIGSSQRSSLLLNNAPGPGSYQIKPRTGNEGSRYTIVGKPEKKPLSSEPGPGAYNPNLSSSMKTLPKYSIASKPREEGRAFTPGPGQYTHSSTVLNRPSMIFPKSLRNDLYYTNKVPGPGSYSKNAFQQIEGPKFGFGTSIRDDFTASGKRAPGPGNYNLSSSFDASSSKGFSMSFRQKLHGNDLVPGPGTYNPEVELMKKSAPSFRIGTSTRDHLGGDSTQPGPGAYQPRMYNRPSTPSYKVGSGVRQPLNENEHTPGPGSYSIPGTNTGPRLTIKGSTAVDPITAEKQRTPGPGQYQSSEKYISNKQRPLSAKIGSGQRSNFLATTKVPGPGNYNLNNSAEGPKWGFGTSIQRQDDTTKVHINQPGPGQYNLKPFFADVPSYAMPHKVNQ